MEPINWDAIKAALSPEDYELVKKKITNGLERYRSYSPILMLNRGLGREFRTLETIKATTLEDAQKQADRLAEKYILQPGYEKAVVTEVKLRFLSNG